MVLFTHLGAGAGWYWGGRGFWDHICPVLCYSLHTARFLALGADRTQVVCEKLMRGSGQELGPGGSKPREFQMVITALWSFARLSMCPSVSWVTVSFAAV